MRATRRGTSDSAARLRALTRRAYTATAGHLDLDDDAGREFDRIVAGPARGEAAGPARGEAAARGHRAPPARRWAVSGRAVAVVLAVVAALTGAVVARAITLGSEESVPVPRLAEPGHVATATADGPAADDGAATTGTPSGGGAASDGTSPAEDGGTATAVDGGGTATGTAREEDGGEATEGAVTVVVHVAGAVTDPGVVELPAGSRVGEAVDAAGGAQPEAELSAVNLARPVQDGEQVYVPLVGEAEPGTAAGVPGAPGDAAGVPGPSGGTGGEPGGGDGPAGSPAAVGVVDLNAADLAALDTLPGVGPAIAQRILDWRAANGPFHAVDELLEVSGIGPATLERLRERVRV